MLFLVPTPIGHLQDMTYRGVQTLREADVIAAEDTRVSRILLSAYEITTPLMSSHQGSDPERVLSLLREGKQVALITDAGSPGISDPGERLLRAVVEEGLSYTVLPGASALTVAMVGSAVRLPGMLYLGFFPLKKGRQKLWQQISDHDGSVCFFESRHRILKLLSEAESHIPTRQMVLCRELTKLHETYLRGTPQELREALETDPHQTKGEFVVVVDER